MAGHSHWANIKRQKASNDKKRGKVWSKIARKIIIAAKGGGDPKENLSLRYVIDEAKAANMPRETIQNAIKKGTGELGAENYESVQYEGYGPGGVAIMIDGLTNNRARTAGELRRIFEFNGGNLATTGAVGFQFTKRGVITIKADAIAEEKLMEFALDAGAEDVTTEGEGYIVTTTPTAFHKIRDAITEANIAIESSEISNVPNTSVAVDADTAKRVLKLLDELEDNEDVQSVAHNAGLPDAG
jgi:YebC/PmpR family DNA-binding regulatory protein